MTVVEEAKRLVDGITPLDDLERRHRDVRALGCPRPPVSSANSGDTSGSILTTGA